MSTKTRVTLPATWKLPKELLVAFESSAIEYDLKPSQLFEALVAKAVESNFAARAAAGFCVHSLEDASVVQEDKDGRVRCRKCHPETALSEDELLVL